MLDNWSIKLIFELLPETETGSAEEQPARDRVARGSIVFQSLPTTHKNKLGKPFSPRLEGFLFDYGNSSRPVN